jgi:hypothetical protein
MLASWLGVATLLGLALSACHPRPSNTVREGVLCRGFELQVFQPAGSRDTLAATGATEDIFRQVSEYQRRAGRSELGWPAIPLWVRWRGRQIGPGSYGHLGQYRYMFVVSEILEMHTLTDSACAWARPT